MEDIKLNVNSLRPQTKRKVSKGDIPYKEREWNFQKKQRKFEEKKRKEMKLLRLNEIVKKKKIQKEKKKQENIFQESNCKKGRDYTVSIALPGSILDNAQSPELRTYLAGQISRAAAVFNVDEIVVFDETCSTERSVEGNYSGIGKKGHASVQLGRILQYLECPQYLRKQLFPQHRDLQYAGLLNPLDSPHHMRVTDKCYYREGLVLKQPIKAEGSCVDVGLPKNIQVDKKIPVGMRVTVKLEELHTGNKLKGTIVSPSTPRTEGNLYWGYTVRLASSLGKVFTESPFIKGYDLIIGTSDGGENVDDFVVPKFRHGLIVFGGIHGLEASLKADETLNINDPTLLFQHYLNTCPGQGSRTIRTEEAILITLSILRPKIKSAQEKLSKNHEIFK